MDFVICGDVHENIIGMKYEGNLVDLLISMFWRSFLFLVGGGDCSNLHKWRKFGKVYTIHCKWFGLLLLHYLHLKLFRYKEECNWTSYHCLSNKRSTLWKNTLTLSRSMLTRNQIFWKKQYFRNLTHLRMKKQSLETVMEKKQIKLLWPKLKVTLLNGLSRHETLD